MRFGRTAKAAGIKEDECFLPVFSVNTEEEARKLLVLTCSRNIDGEYFAPGLADKQSLERLYGFGHRLARGYEFMKSRSNSAG